MEVGLGFRWLGCWFFLRCAVFLDVGLSGFDAAALIGAIVPGSERRQCNGHSSERRAFGLTRGLIEDRGVHYGPRFGLAWHAARALDNPVAKLFLDHWQVTGITSFVSGAPVAVGSTAGNQLSAIGSYAMQGISAATLNRRTTGNEGWSPRPVLSCNPNLSTGDRTLYALINTSCFHPAAVGSTGMDSAIRPIRGPGVE